MIGRKLNDLHVDSFASFKSECNVFKKVILRKFDSKREDVGEIYLFLLQNYSEAAPFLTALYKLCVTRGCASARVECLFSAMTYVDAPRRHKSESWRECALTHLLFEKEMVRGISFNEFATEWQPCCVAFHDMDDFVPHTLHLFSSKSKKGRGSCQNRTIVRSGEEVIKQAYLE